MVRWTPVTTDTISIGLVKMEGQVILFPPNSFISMTSKENNCFPTRKKQKATEIRETFEK